MSDVPEPGQLFALAGRRGRWRCLAVSEAGVECYGGSTDPGGRQGFRTFPTGASFRVVRQEEKSRV